MAGHRGAHPEHLGRQLRRQHLPGRSGRHYPSGAEPATGRPAARVHLNAENAWRLCTRGIPPAAAFAGARVNGDRQLAEAACRIVSIVH